jgi:hypothetical protein
MATVIWVVPGQRADSRRSASWPVHASIAKQVNRSPPMSVNRSCARVRAFLADDQPHALQPGGQVHHAGQLGDSRGAASVVCRCPRQAGMRRMARAMSSVVVNPAE